MGDQPDLVLTLACRNCGGRLTIQKDTDRFACGYCGTEQVVERSGGTVSLKIVTAVEGIHRATDQMADELAVQRLHRTRDEITAKLKARTSRLAKAYDSANSAGVLLIVLGVFILLPGASLLVFSTSGAATVLGLAVAGLGLVVAVIGIAILGSLTPPSRDQEVRKLKVELSGIEQEAAQRLQRINGRR